MTSGKHPPTQGTCLCGTVRYEIDGPFDMMVHCHCSMCRKHHGGSFATFVSAPLMGFRWISGHDNLATYASSAKGQRSFCRTCGSVAPLLMKDMDIVVCPAGNLLGELNLRPQAHWFVGSKAPWYTVTDGKPQHEEYPEEFASTGVTRAPVEPREGVVTGSCLCGEVAYEATGQPVRMMNCHCTRCRRARSTAHGTNMFWKIENFRFLRGEANLASYKVPEALHFAVTFCRHCGGAMPHISRERGIVIVPAGTVDTDPGMQPQAHIYVGSKANWFDITDTLPQFREGIT